MNEHPGLMVDNIVSVEMIVRFTDGTTRTITFHGIDSGHRVTFELEKVGGRHQPIYDNLDTLERGTIDETTIVGTVKVQHSPLADGPTLTIADTTEDNDG
jgi:hypothetical protein